MSKQRFETAISVWVDLSIAPKRKTWGLTQSHCPTATSAMQRQCSGNATFCPNSAAECTDSDGGSIPGKKD